MNVLHHRVAIEWCLFCSNQLNSLLHSSCDPNRKHLPHRKPSWMTLHAPKTAFCRSILQLNNQWQRVQWSLDLSSVHWCSCSWRAPCRLRSHLQPTNAISRHALGAERYAGSKPTLNNGAEHERKATHARFAQRPCSMAVDRYHAPEFAWLHTPHESCTSAGINFLSNSALSFCSTQCSSFHKRGWFSLLTHAFQHHSPYFLHLGFATSASLVFPVPFTSPPALFLLLSISLMIANFLTQKPPPTEIWGPYELIR